MEIVCKRCNNTWDYKGSSRRVACSKCKTSITISHQPEPVHVIETIIPKSKQSIAKEVKFTKTLWKDARLSQRMMGLENMGEKWLVLKVDDDGFLSL